MNNYTQQELITAYITCRFIEYHLNTEHKELQQRTQRIRDSLISYLNVESCDYLLQFGVDLCSLKVKRSEQKIFSKDNNSNKKPLSAYKSVNVLNKQPTDTNWIDTNDPIIVALPMVITSTVMTITISAKDSSGEYCIIIRDSKCISYQYAPTIKKALFKATLIQLCAISYKQV